MNAPQLYAEIPAPGLMRALVLAELLRHDSPVRGIEIHKAIGAMVTEEVRALQQNPRASGRGETQLANAIYRAFRVLKSQGHVAVVTARPATYELTDSGRAAAKVGA